MPPEIGKIQEGGVNNAPSHFMGGGNWRIKMGFKYAVVGATGNVGREILQILAEREVPAEDVTAIASSRSVGAEVSYGEDDVLKVEELTAFDFEGTDIVLSSPGAKVSAEFAPRAAAAGAVIIDNTSHFRMDPDVPLVVPEVNPEAIGEFRNKNIIANPNCSTIQLVVALKPLHDLAGIRRVVVSTYQSVSGAGKSAMDELFNQTKGIYMNQPESKFQENFPKQIAFNTIPHIDSFMEDGFTKEEWKMMVETKKILDPKIRLTATCVRVPVFVGHAEAVNIEFENSISTKDAREALRAAEGVVVVDHRVEEGYVTQAECAGEDPVYVSRIRDDMTVENGLSLWIVADNLRKGAALNTVQIAETLIRDYL
jgi:aspartate-semialdehyde dehydrogenase